MRTVYIDIDTLRPDHLGCYGYHRNTSPNIDKIASEGVLFENCYVSDSPCLPSRSAFYSGKCGIRNGAINHGGYAADPFIDTQRRHFRTFYDNFTCKLRDAGIYPVTVSPFGERHSSFWFYNGFREMINTGKGGSERADEVVPHALDWLDRKGKSDNWYLHINIWDPHTPYQVPESEKNPFENDPPPAWMNQDIISKNYNNYGPGCGREPGGCYNGNDFDKKFPRMCSQISNMDEYKKWIDGYDTGIYYADKHVELIVSKLRKLGILNDTMIIISSDHGENQGELSVYGDHQTADHITNRVPMIIRHPKGIGGKGRKKYAALHYQFDVGATILEMLGAKVPETWDGVSFLEKFEKGIDQGRDYLVISNCAWSCQRSVRWSDYLLIRTYHSGFKNYPDIMLFNVKNDPHETRNLAEEKKELVYYGLAMLEEWFFTEMSKSHTDVDPMWTVMREGGPYHANYSSSTFQKYLERLQNTGRSDFREELEKQKNILNYNPVNYK